MDKAATAKEKTYPLSLSDRESVPSETVEIIIRKRRGNPGIGLINRPVRKHTKHDKETKKRGRRDNEPNGGKKSHRSLPRLGKTCANLEDFALSYVR